MQRSLWPKKRARRPLNKISIKSSQPDPNPGPRNEQASKIRRVIYTQTLFTFLFFYVFFDASSRFSNVIEFIWGEAYRAILVESQTQQSFKVSFSNPDLSRVSATVTLPDMQGAPLSEVLAHWLAGDSPTILDNLGREIEIASVEFSLPMRTIGRNVSVFISKKGAFDSLDYIYVRDTANLSVLSTLQDVIETDWPPNVTAYFNQECKANINRTLSFTTKNIIEEDLGSPTSDESLEDAAIEANHLVSMQKVDLLFTMATDRFGPIPRLNLTRNYRLNRRTINDSHISCMQFVPELQWINRSDYVSRGIWGLDTLAPLPIYWTEDGTPQQSDLERLVERVQSPSTSIPTVSESFPLRVFFMAAPWVSILLSLILSRRIRALGREWGDISRIAFFGAPSHPKPKLSFLDGPFIRFLERISCLIPALIASIAPIAISIVAHLPDNNTHSVMAAAILYDFFDQKNLLAYTYLIANSIFNDVNSSIQIFLSFIIGLHILFVILKAYENARSFLDHPGLTRYLDRKRP